MTENSLERTGASLLIKALQQNGINNIYGLVGIPVTDFARLAELRGMKYYGFRREDSAVDAAAAAGYLTQKPGVALTVSAPGFLNGLTALAQATKNCFPLIMISGSSERHIIDLSQGDYEGLDQYNVAKPFCKKAYRVDRAEDIGLAVARAIRTAVSGRPGGVYLDLPADTISQEAPTADTGIYKLVDPAPKQEPSDEAVSRAVNIIKNAQKPLIILGKGAAYARTEEQVQKLVNETGIPFLPMSMAKGVVPDDNKYSAASARSLSLKNADAVILIGARLNWMLSYGDAPQFNPDAKFIQLDIDATQFDSSQKISAPLQGDLQSILAKLVPALIKSGYHTSEEWLDQIAQDTAKNDAKFAERIAAGKTNPKFGYYGAIEPIAEYFNEHPDTYIVSEGANTLDIGRNMIGMKLPRHRLDTGTWGVMGVGMGYAIATAIETGKHVVALDGDSAFGFDGMEMETICRYKLPITVVVINNGGIYNGVDQVVPDQLGPTTLDPTGRYDLMAKAFGGDNYFVSNYQEMKDTFAKAVESGRPNLINVQIDPSMGKESGHIGNLNPALNLKPLEEAERSKNND
ncbi:oxalyl-CoA decarboxylase [Limosilactobacillus fastidiosus]|uniref:Oxalyl-CoA decarboxylase n=1 Tax=Limosilactobacillus fastidiosus TaxID=2759855 RepID=A0A7W3TZD2_9LACO|nr:oxalyl-CoA decarboxylase [Limosilactobacillus fastidiosus]MBB1086093.1 oxalyl-CoA decarboxylase [Limosilactobacillus fastidiosus]MCD7085007.1 oxalyl-CoA decarboxylase [Limosilactobacillus fastidiosus]MCD7114519.1 oxalyl-CoA decarboxylase [Limosilactobacillus fastidiosus]MCD7116593.1 oxalyl-CoA decarboxylase [Limosilactobacillus fastidiosus]